MADLESRRYATPLLLALVAVEVTDLIFAIFGLRSLYFLLAGIISKFVYLKVGLSFVLIFVGAKMLLAIKSVRVTAANARPAGPSHLRIGHGRRRHSRRRDHDPEALAGRSSRWHRTRAAIVLD